MGYISYELSVDESDSTDVSDQNIAGMGSLLSNILFTFEFTDRTIKKVKTETEYELQESNKITFKLSPENMTNKKELRSI